MRTIRVETSAATILLTEAPEPKVRDRQTGEIAKDAVSGEALMTIGVVYIEEGVLPDQGHRSRERGVRRTRARSAGLAARPRGPTVGERVQRAAAARHRLPLRRRHSGRVPGRHGATA